MAVIKVYKNGIEYSVLVSEMDFAELNKYKWQVIKESNHLYVARCEYKNGSRKWYRMHRQILGLTNPKRFVDHKNHNGLDNRRENIRECSPAENSRNLKARRSGLKGVSVVHRKKFKRYEALIKVDGKRKLLGMFETELEAGTVYDFYATLYHGDFACLNFPLSPVLNV
jgi:hypothetical protein